MSPEEGHAISVIVPIELWCVIASERETAYLLKSETMKKRLLEAKNRNSLLRKHAITLPIYMSYFSIIRFCFNPKMRLCSNLEQAAVMLDAFGDGPIWSDYDSAPALAKYIRSLIRKIEDGSISGEEKKTLWNIFAPTCDWDDIVTDVQLGERVFGLVERVFPETKP